MKILSLVAALIASFTIPAAEAPRILPFQGRLTDQAGNTVSNGTKVVQFKMFSEPVGGTPVWPGEIHRTTVNGGLVNVLLGTKSPFPSTNSAGLQFFNQPLYLEITVDINSDGQITVADPPMLPRQVILPVVFAKEAADARTLNGYDWSPLFGTNDPESGTIMDAKIRDGSINANKLSPHSIHPGLLSSNSITAGQMAKKTLTSNEIAAGSLDMSLLARQVAEALNPPGTIVAYGGDTNKIRDLAPGWLLCDGRGVRSLDYPLLFAAIGTNWGGGLGNAGGTNFNLPDLRGVFLRGVSGGRSDQFRDPEASTRTNSITVSNLEGGRVTGGNAGNTVGSFQVEQFQRHDHDLTYSGNHTDFAGGSLVLGNVSVANSTVAPARIGDAGGPETRPNNAGVHYIIKF